MPIAVNPEVIKIVGPNAAIVYAQIDYWLNKANNGNNRFVVHKADQRWVAKSREGLCDETGLTAQQLRCAIEKLLKEGLIERERHLFNGKVTAHFRVTTGQADLGDVTQMEQAKMTQTEQAYITQTDLGDLTQNIYIETVLETKKDIGVVDADGGCATQIFSGELEMVSKKSGYSVSDMLAGHSASKKVEKVAPENSKKPGQLASVFRTAFTESYPDLFLPSFISKELGQFGLFATRCGQHNPRLVIDHCVRNWGSFKSAAISEQGAIKPPDFPSIGTMLKFVQTAVNLYLADTAPPKPVQLKKAPKPHNPPPKPVEALKTAPKAPEDEIVTDPAMVDKLLGFDYD